MKNLCTKVAWLLIAVSVTVMGSGPRVTGALFTSIPNEVVAVETPPFFSNRTPSGGMMFEIVNAALKSEKESASLTTYPIQKMVDYYLTQEKVLAALGTNFNLSEKEKKNIISIPVALVQEQYLYYKPAHPNGITWGGKMTDLKGLIYGAQAGEDTSAYTEAKIKVVYSQTRFLFKKLKAEKVDFIKVPVLSAKEIINSHFSADKNKFSVMASEPQQTVCMIHFNRHNPEAEAISKKFTQGLSTILKNGQYQAIIEKYEGKTPLSSQHIMEFTSLWKKTLLK